MPAISECWSPRDSRRSRILLGKPEAMLSGLGRPCYVHATCTYLKVQCDGVLSNTIRQLCMLQIRRKRGNNQVVTDHPKHPGRGTLRGTALGSGHLRGSAGCFGSMWRFTGRPGQDDPQNLPLKSVDWASGVPKAGSRLKLSSRGPKNGHSWAML